MPLELLKWDTARWCENACDMHAGAADGIAIKLMALGFAADDVTDALAATGTSGAAGGQALEACLDWLCMHMPEADLPLAFGPGGPPRSCSRMVQWRFSCCVLAHLLMPASRSSNTNRLLE